jgi:peptide/nickel transport system substrate-binding protein
MTWHYSLPEGEDEGPTELIIEDWGRVGIRAIRRQPSLPLFTAEQNSRQVEFSIWATESEFNPIIGPERFVGLTGLQAFGYFMWYLGGGLSDNPEATKFGGIEPPIDHPLRRSMKLLESVFSATTREAQREQFNKIFDIAAENVWSINITTPPPHPVIVKNDFKNVPRLAFYGNRYRPPSHAGLETFYFEDPYHSPGTIAQIKKELIEITPAPYGLVDDKGESKSVNRFALLVKYLFISVLSAA